MTEEDAELAAIREATRVIETLAPDARARVAAYLAHRFGVGSITPSLTERSSPPDPGGKSADHAAGKSRDIALQRFAGRNGIPVERFEEIIDFESRDVHNLSPWKGVVEQTCRLAGMLSLCQVAADGTFAVAQKDLARAARRHAVYDADSTSTYLRRFRYRGSIVFTRDKAGEPWRVTPAGQQFVAETVKQALGLETVKKGERAEKPTQDPD